MRGEWLQNPTSDTAAVFVHGILSSGESGWRNANGAYWPALLQSEKDLHGLGLYVYSYQTDIFSGNYQLGDVVDDLKERMKLDDVLKSRRIIFVCHSMGGIVVRQYLVTRALDLIAAQVHVGLFLVASPSLGSEYANWLEVFANIFGNSQAQALRFAQDNTWLNDLDKNFKNLHAAGKLQLTGKELIEDNFIVLKKLFRKQIVEPFSGARYFGEPYKVPHSDHFSIAKPESATAIQHRLLVQFIKEIQQAPSQYSSAHASSSSAAPANVALNAQGDIAARDVVGRDKIVDQSVTIIHQATAPVFNPLHQLPSPPRDFTGREEELRELLAGLESGGAMISGLHGMGGIGKTTLALVLAEKLKPQYPEAQFFLDLRGASSNPLSVAEAMAHVIRAYHPEARLPETEAELAPLYLSVLHNQRALLFFDDARDAEHVAPLLPPAPCALLVTSRRHFTLPGLYAKDLNQLSPIEAEALLLKICSRIAALAPELARLCGYLPLALRLAASALAARRDLSPNDYARRLQNAQQLVALIDASLRLSYDLLAPKLQAEWRALAVFPESFDRNAAAAVWQMAEDPAHDTLSTLYNYSLLDWQESTQRYRLHDLARLFAEAHLAEKEKLAAQQRHAEHFKDVLEEAKELYKQGNEAMLQGLRLFDTEWPNIAAGQAWAVAHMQHNQAAAHLCNDYPNAGVYVLALRQHAREKITWLESALAAARQLQDREREGIHLGNLGNAYAALGETRRAIAFYEQALVIDREIGDRRGEGTDLGNLGLAYKNLGETRRAIAFYEQALKVMQEIGDRRAEGSILGNLGSAYFSLGETRRAIQYYEQALKVMQEIGDRRAEGSIVGNLGSAYFSLGETRRAIEFYEQHLAIAREIGDRRGEGNALGGLGVAYQNLGEIRRAIEYHEQYLVIAREIGDRRGEGNALGNLGLAYADLGETRRAIEYYEQYLAIAREIGDRRGEGNALGNLGLAYSNLGETRRAIEYHEQALQISREIGDRRAEGQDLGNLGNAYADLGETRRAIEFYEQALEIDREIGDRRGEGADLGNLGNAYYSLGEIRRAIAFYEQVLEIDREIGDRRGEGADLGNLGIAYKNLGETRRAIEYHEQYLAIAREIGDRRGEVNALWNMSLAFDQLNERERALPLAAAALQIYEQIEDPNAEQVRRKLAQWSGGVKIEDRGL